MPRIVVTGGSGKAGRAVMERLVREGVQAVNVDIVPPRDPVGDFLRADLTDLGQTYEALRGARAVVHLAAIPAPGLAPDAVTFHTNVDSTYNVFTAAVAFEVESVVWASSETVLGLPFDREQPAYAPIDELHPRYPESSYAVSKLLGEELADQLSRWSGIPFVGLRISNIMEPDDYRQFPGFQEDPRLRKWNLWGYVDARDVAQAVLRGLDAGVEGAQVCIIAAGDTVMERPSRQLMEEVYPKVPLREELAGRETLLSIDRARTVLGYEPQYSWRDQI